MTYEEEVIQAIRIHTAEIIKAGPEECRKYIASLIDAPNEFGESMHSKKEMQNMIHDLIAKVGKLRECLSELVEDLDSEEKFGKTRDFGKKRNQIITKANKLLKL